MCSFFLIVLKLLFALFRICLGTIYSENAVLLALSLCCFIHAVKYMMPSLISMSV